MAMIVSQGGNEISSLLNLEWSNEAKDNAYE